MSLLSIKSIINRSIYLQSKRRKIKKYVLIMYLHDEQKNNPMPITKYVYINTVIMNAEKINLFIKAKDFVILSF